MKEWGPDLYNTCAVINAVLEHLLICDNDKDVYLESLAMLYSYDKKYDKSLSMYLKLVHRGNHKNQTLYLNNFRLKHKDVFNLIQKHNLYNVIHDMIIELMDLDAEKTIAMLLEKNRIPPEVVVEKLKNHEQLLYKVTFCLRK